VTSAYFTILDEQPSGGRYSADPATGGPWAPGLQHGGPPSALLVRASERAAEASQRSDLHAVRLAVEFVGPVPVAEVEVEARVVRSARTAVLVEATLSAADRTCLQGRVWLVRDLDTATISAPLAEPEAPPHGLPGIGAEFPYGSSIEWQAVSGSLHTPGPGLVWARPRRGLIDGEPLSGLQRVALVGDSASGISAELDWSAWSFVNVDLDVHLARPVEGDWVLIDARTTLGGHGSALARATISDLRGQVGATAQTLVLSPR
jgi:acyl-coenzyme A thioesterase PaaI-like protein